ncbi:MAG: hypothetical protein RQ824_05350 [bacterium]|nr:hypothetical protein [bacterium]
MKRKASIISAVLTIIAIALFSITVGAQPPEGKEKCDKPYSKDCDKKDKKDCDKSKKDWKQGKHRFDILDYTKELDLSDNQVAKIKDIKTAHKKEIIKLQADIDVLEVDLKGFHRDYTTGMDTIAKKVREIEAKKGDKQIAKYQMMRDVREVLTEKQRTMIREIMQKKKSAKK